MTLISDSMFFKHTNSKIQGFATNNCNAFEYPIILNDKSL